MDAEINKIIAKAIGKTQDGGAGGKIEAYLDDNAPTDRRVDLLSAYIAKSISDSFSPLEIKHDMEYAIRQLTKARDAVEKEFSYIHS